MPRLRHSICSSYGARFAVAIENGDDHFLNLRPSARGGKLRTLAIRVRHVHVQSNR